MAKADKALVRQRVDDLYRIVLEGALWPVDTCEYVREKQAEAGSLWFLAEGETPLSESQIRRYQQKADKLIEQAGTHSRKRLFRRHLAQRRHLFAKANLAGDIGTALRCLRDEAELLGLYAPLKHEHAGPQGRPMQHHVDLEAFKLLPMEEKIRVMRERIAASRGPEEP